MITPFSPRPRNKWSRLSNGVRASGADFWKRFSVSVRLDEIDREKGSSSDWLSKAQAKRSILKKIAWLSALMILVIIAVVVAVVIVKNSKSDNSSKTEGNL